MIKIIEKNNEENRKYNLKYARLLNDKISFVEFGFLVVFVVSLWLIVIF